MGRRARWVGAAGIAVALSSGCAVGTYDVAYDDVHQARGHEAVERGWVPEWLPEGTVDIVQRHTSEAAVLRADLPVADRLPDTCVAASDQAGPTIRVDWLPDDVAERGTAVTCDGWTGVLDGADLFIWQ